MQLIWLCLCQIYLVMGLSQNVIEELFGSGQFLDRVQDSNHLSSSIEDLKVLFRLERQVLKNLSENPVENVVVKNYQKLVDYE